ncbi:MAG: pyruvate synthase subunit beta [Candidatus Desulfofervidus auxilii]|nr:pyruvate synthase subunit beta [Candidatus Desulfofervidus auxilii]
MAVAKDFTGFKARELPKEEYFSPGHRACQGCAGALAVRLILKAVGNRVIVTSATGCMEIISSPFPQTAWEVPWIHVAFENAAAVASGIEAGLKVLMRKGRLKEEKIFVLAIAGDGGTADIGLQALSGALERGHDFVYICIDNEAYMNTGIQRSSSTPYGARTTTSPAGRKSIGQMTWKKNVAEIAVAHHIPYVATVCPSYYLDLMNKVKKAALTPGPAYIHCLAPCPTGWRCAPNLAIEIGRLAVETGVFPLYEVINGEYKIQYPHRRLKPVREYLQLQGRFRHLTDEYIEIIQKRVTEDMAKLRALEKFGSFYKNVIANL